MSLQKLKGLVAYRVELNFLASMLIPAFRAQSLLPKKGNHKSLSVLVSDAMTLLANANRYKIWSAAYMNMTLCSNLIHLFTFLILILPNATVRFF